MKVVGIIPARGGSKGVPRKNIRPLLGKPLVAYTIEAAIKSKYVDKVIVSTEDDEIARVCEQFGSEVIKRPQELANDEAKTAPVVKHVIDELINQGYQPDIIVLLQPTCPLRDEVIIDAVIEQLINSDKDSIFTGFGGYPTMPHWVRKPDGEVFSLYDYHKRPRRQESEQNPLMYTENGAVYAIKWDAFQKTHDFLGDSVDIFIMEQQIDIDTPEQFKLAEKELNKRNSVNFFERIKKYFHNFCFSYKIRTN